MKEWKEKHEAMKKEQNKDQLKWNTLSGLKPQQAPLNSSVETIGKYLQQKKT